LTEEDKRFFSVIRITLKELNEQLGNRQKFPEKYICNNEKEHGFGQIKISKDSNPFTLVKCQGSFIDYDIEVPHF